MKRLVTRLAIAGLVATSLVGAASMPAQAGGGASLQQGSLVAVVTDCQYGPWFYGEGPYGPSTPGLFVPMVVKNQNCISVDAYVVDTMTSGTISVKIPQGMTVTKKIAAPTNLTWYDPMGGPGMGGCSWSGSWSLQSAGTAQTLKLTGVTCGAGSYLAAFFTATVKNPTTTSYQPYNVTNLNYAENLACSGSPSLAEAWVFNGIPTFYLSAYLVTGQYTTTKSGAALATVPTYFGIAPDFDYYSWMFAYYGLFGYTCGA